MRLMNLRRDDSNLDYSKRISSTLIANGCCHHLAIAVMAWYHVYRSQSSIVIGLKMVTGYWEENVCIETRVLRI